MAGVFDKLSDLHRQKLNWRFKVYVKRLYEHRFAGSHSYSLEMIIQDSEGVRVHASISSQLVKKWVGLINEFKMYEMENFIVVDKKPFIRSTTTPFSLLFSHRTKVKVVEDPSFPLDVFNFKPFTEILNADNVDDSEMFDVIGEVVGKEEARVVVTSKGVHVKRMAIVLEDLGSNRLCCVLFGGLVDQILPHLNEESFDPRSFNKTFFINLINTAEKTSIQSSFDLSGLHINAELSVVDEFRSILLNGETSNGIRITQLQSQSVVSATQELKNGNVFVSSVEDIFNAEEESKTWIFGKIVAVCAGKRNWTYESCIKCYKKAERNSEGKYFYKKCFLEYEAPKNRYKDKDDDEHPIAFDKMLEMKLLFKINVKTSNIKEADTVYAVMKICDDDEMIQKYLPPEFEADACVSPNEVGGSNSVDVSGLMVNLESDVDTHPIVRSIEHFVNSVKSKAAAKKCTSTLKSCIKDMQSNEQGQSSTNRGKKKTQKKGVKRVRIFVKCHAKTVGRLRTLSKFWSERLKGKLFVEQHWEENEDRDDNVLIGLGYTPYGEKSHCCVGVNADTGEETDLQPPLTLVEYDFFIIIGSDRGNLCIRYSEKGEECGLMVWNPII
ncbi:hypothetical protein PIB30_032396 [Stylosanthes scabra]|uniref:Replication protein A 70 kDa DNA-binding subunit B/D first OB fold domain-containing protein n=1 Tax=Stylosanthes scabra TaxID=79078 RepID=A0ABU6WF52_9FABA|nr:hypothetical protein [Stylosanthes scabra]